MELMISCRKPSIALQMAHCIWGYCSIKQTLLATLLRTLESFWMCALVSEVKRLPIFHIIPNFLHTPACVRCTWGETQREKGRGQLSTWLQLHTNGLEIDYTWHAHTQHQQGHSVQCALLMGKKRNITQRSWERKGEKCGKETSDKRNMRWKITTNINSNNKDSSNSSNDNSK